MAKVPYPELTNGSIGSYGKFQSILVDSFEKKMKLGKIKSKKARKGKAAQNLVKNSS